MKFASTIGLIAFSTLAAAEEKRYEYREYLESPSDAYVFQATLSPSAFGGITTSDGGSDAETAGVSFAAEYQPSFLRSFGTIGFGPIFSGYPVAAGHGVTQDAFSVWSIGAQVRYQFRALPDQILVPTFSYQFHRLHYSFMTGEMGWSNLEGPAVGVELSLSNLDPEKSWSLQEQSGITGTYLIIEARHLKNTSGGGVTTSGPGWYFGMGFEL